MKYLPLLKYYNSINSSTLQHVYTNSSWHRYIVQTQIHTCKVDVFALSVEKNSSLNSGLVSSSSVSFGKEHKASTRWWEEADVGHLTFLSSRFLTYM